MTVYVIDANVVIKWVVEEQGSAEALALLAENSVIAPELILAECANILWKKARRGEFSANEARFAALMIEGSDLQIREMLPLWINATELAIRLDHPASDCMYLALAYREGLQFVTADERLIRKLQQHPDHAMRAMVVSLQSLS